MAAYRSFSSTPGVTLRPDPPPLPLPWKIFLIIVSNETRVVLDEGVVTMGDQGEPGETRYPIDIGVTDYLLSHEIYSGMSSPMEEKPYNEKNPSRLSYRILYNNHN